MDQSLSSYRIFYVVAKAGNISKAAKELFISQPAISKSIQKLEESLGVTLFYRSSRGVTLTPEGTILFEHVSSAFDTLSLGEEKLRHTKSLGMEHLTIGVSATLCKYILLPSLKEFMKRHPHIAISISCHSTDETLRLLADRKLDIGLIGQPAPLRDLSFCPLTEIEDIFVATKDYLQQQRLRGISRKDILKSSTLMLLNKENITRRYVDDYFLENRIEAAEVIDVSSMELLIEFAKVGLGIACVIRDFVREELSRGTLVELSVGPALKKRPVGFAYPSSGTLPDAANCFIQYYKSTIL